MVICDNDVDGGFVDFFELEVEEVGVLIGGEEISLMQLFLVGYYGSVIMNVGVVYYDELLWLVMVNVWSVMVGL